jgi:hypothetical protein
VGIQHACSFQKLAPYMPRYITPITLRSAAGRWRRRGEGGHLSTIYCTLHSLRGSGSDFVGAHAMRRPEAKGWRLAVAWAVAVFCCSVSRLADALPYSGLSASEDNALFVYFEDPGDRPSVGQRVVLSDLRPSCGE